MKAFVFGLLLVLIGSSPQALADEVSYNKTKADTEALFQMKGDLLAIKIAIDKWIDPTIDEQALRKQFDDYAAPLSALLQGVETDHKRLKVLRHFLYDAGAWNQNHPLHYDFADPYAKVAGHRLLSYTLNERQGNCISMPSLMMMLGQKAGLKMTLSVLPKHSFVKFTDEQNQTWNLEATSGGGYTRDSYYRDKFRFSEKAVASGAYMSTLSEEQTIALMAQLIPEWLMQQNRPEEATAAYGVILNHYPQSVTAWVGRGSSYAMILRRDYLTKFKSMKEMTVDQRQEAIALSTMNKNNFDQAEALGWSDQDDLKSALQTATQDQRQD